MADRVRANPAITTGMSPEEVVLSVPPGSLLFVDYVAGSTTTKRAKEESSAAIDAGMRYTHFVGRLIDAGQHGDGRVHFRMVCLNRGEPGKGAVRSFSTGVGTLRGVLLLELPEERTETNAAA